MSRGLRAWLCVLVPMWIVLVLCTHWEPIVHDTWGHRAWHRNLGLSVEHLWAFTKATYQHNNPRLGQVVTLVLCTKGPWHSIFTPLIELALFYLLASHALARWASLRNRDDALVFVTIAALVCATSPVIGPMLLYRPYMGNYVFGLDVALATLMPFRFHVARPLAPTWWLTPLLGVGGLAAGLCNEHTDPAVALAMVVAIAYFIRRDRRPPVWAFAALVGVVAGGWILLHAPGQEIRYGGLALRQSPLQRIADRGIVGNLEIYGRALLVLSASLPWLLLAFVARRNLPAPAPLPRDVKLSLYAGLAMAFAIVTTLLVSPKQGMRLDFAATASAAIGIGAVVIHLTAQLAWARRAVWVMSAGLLVWIGIRFVMIYPVLSRESDERITALEHAPEGSVLALPRYSYDESWYFLGEDLRFETVRGLLAKDYRLAKVVLADP